MEIARTENIESEGLVKHYDSRDRIVKIEFTRSGNSCTIQYPSVPAPVSAFSSPFRLVTWSNGYRYLVYKKGDATAFKAMSETKPNESAWGDLKFEECDAKKVKKAWSDVLKSNLKKDSQQCK